MKLKNIDIYCFSGTGNTLLVVKEMIGTFEERGVKATLHRLEKSDPAGIDLKNTIGLAFPVAAQSTYPLVWDFFEKMPEAEGTGVFMVDTLAAFSGGIVGPLRKVLRGKGYRPLGAREIKMPSNYYHGRKSPEKSRRIIEKGLKEAAGYALALIEGTARWGRVPFLSDTLCVLFRSRVIWKFLSKIGRKFTADREKCAQCRSCLKLCPVGNIAMEEYPVFADRCQQCMRCISFCPVGAIHVPGKEYEPYQAVKLGEMLGESSA